MFQDRVALAVHFLVNKPSELMEYLNDMIEICTKEVNLQGILLTGLSNRSIDLFQAYTNKTGDIQTAVLSLIHSTFNDVLESNKVKYWIESYRELLNKWKLWSKRAEFDIFKMKLIKLNQATSETSVSLTPKHAKSQKHSQESLVVNILCNNCGKNVYEKTMSTRVHTTSISSSNNTSIFLNPNSAKPSSILTSNGSAKFQNEVIIGCSHCRKLISFIFNIFMNLF
jgi:WD repeat-containing protein mio